MNQKMEVADLNPEDCPKLLDLMENKRDWLVNDREDFLNPEDKKLELKLGPPGDYSVTENTNTCRGKVEPLLSLDSHKLHKNGNYSCGTKRGIQDTDVERNWSKNCSERPNWKILSQKQSILFPSSWSSEAISFQLSQKQNQAILHLQSIPNSSNQSKQEGVTNHKTTYIEKNSSSPNEYNNNNSHIRNSSTPVVGWPPIRSFRKNIASSSKLPLVSQTEVVKKEEKTETIRKGFFVKVTVDGLPIGRKIDVKAHTSYEELSMAVNELFKGFLAVRNDCHNVEKKKAEDEDTPAIKELLDENGDYTLVYEDDEGDKMLVGDVPWNMFLSTVRRLRVLRSSELFTCITRDKEKISANFAVM